MRFAIVRFPGTWSDVDCYHAVADVLGQSAEIVWHRETSLEGFDFGPQYEALTLHHPTNRGQDLVSDRLKLGLKVKKGKESFAFQVGIRLRGVQERVAEVLV